jgi:hypothetical protein
MLKYRSSPTPDDISIQDLPDRRPEEIECADRDRHGVVPCELSHSEMGRRAVMVPAIHPPMWPKTQPKAEARHNTTPP